MWNWYSSLKIESSHQSTRNLGSKLFVSKLTGDVGNVAPANKMWDKRCKIRFILVGWMIFQLSSSENTKIYSTKNSSFSLMMVVDESLKRKKNDLEVAFWVHRCGLIIMHLRSVVVWRCNKTCLRGAPHLTSVSTLLIPTLFSFSENIPKKLEQFHFVYLPAFLWIPFPCFHCVGSKQNTG